MAFSNGNPLLLLRDPRALRWVFVGVAFMALNLALLYLVVSVMGIPFAAAPLLVSEVGIVLRFLTNDRWVFGNRRPTWRRLWEYHVAIAGAFAVWWVAANTLVHFGVHYLVASVLATGCSVFCNLASNFLWIWKKAPETKPNEIAGGG